MRSCESCGKAIEGDAPSGLCPACMLRTAIEYGANRTAAGLLPKLRYFGDYELLEEIARGGMGVVYRARQVSLDRIVAVKMMRPGLLATEAEIRRFREEAKTAASLQHPNIVAIHEVGEFDGLHYFSMDFVEGPNLGELVRERPIAPAEAARYVRIIAEAVQFAHGKRVLHRDLKPSNVLVDSSGQPRITDFGLARPLDSDAGATATATGALLGTPSYMPPEQAAAQPGRLSPASDVYSLGAILYELLTGRPPFRGASQLETVRMVEEQDPVPPRALQPEVSRELEAVCLHCLEKDPARRYQSASDLASDLQRFLADEPVAVRARRRRWPMAAAGVAALAILLVAVLWHPGSAPQPAVPHTAAPIPTAPVEAPKTIAPAPAKKAKVAKPAAKKPEPVELSGSASKLVDLDLSVYPNLSMGYSRVFSFRYFDPYGTKDIEDVELNFHEGKDGVKRDCAVFVTPATGHVKLQANPEGGPGLTVSGDSGELRTIENPVCAVDLSGVSIERGSDLRVQVPIVFRPSFDGPKEIWTQVWTKSPIGRRNMIGHWTVGPVPAQAGQ